MNDLISRQAAIDEIRRCRFVVDAIEKIRKLSSAQPDHFAEVSKKATQTVITCDGCRFVGTYDTDLPCCGCVRREKDYYEPER